MAATVTYVDTDSIVGSATTFNHTAVGTGTAAADRVVAVVTQGTQSGVTANSVTSITVGGNAASHKKTRFGGTDAGGNRVATSLWVVALPSGTSENIDVVWQATMFDNVVSTFALTGIDGSVFDEDEDFSGAGDPHTANLSIDMPAGSVAVASCAEFNASAETWSGFTERNAQLNFVSNRYSVADFTAAVEQLPLVGTVAFTGSPTTMAALAVSFASATSDAVLASAGSASTSFIGVGVVEGALASAGVATASWSADIAFTMPGVGAANFVGSVLLDGVVSGAGVAAGTFVGAAFEGALSVSGVSVVEWSSLVPADGAIGASALAEVGFVGVLGLRWNPEAGVVNTWTPEAVEI